MAQQELGMNEVINLSCLNNKDEMAMNMFITRNCIYEIRTDLVTRRTSLLKDLSSSKEKGKWNEGFSCFVFVISLHHSI